VACIVHYYAQEAVEAFWATWKTEVGTDRLGAAGRRPGDGRGNQAGGHGRAWRPGWCLHGLQARLCDDVASLDSYLPPHVAELARKVASVLEEPQPATA
jgi:hypothetical protein